MDPNFEFPKAHRSCSLVTDTAFLRFGCVILFLKKRWIHALDVLNLLTCAFVYEYDKAQPVHAAVYIF